MRESWHWLVVTWVCVVLACLLMLVDSLHERSAREKVHEYNGVTWIGDACYVKDEVLWCEASS